MSAMPLRNAVRELAELLPAIEALTPRLQATGQALLDCWERDGKVLTCGNGGSACDAMHLAEELTVRFQKNRKPLGALALLDPSALTCAGNDFGFETVFSRQVEALGRDGDVLVVFTTSGNSPNILKAVEAAEQRGLTTVAFLGRDGGKLAGRCEYELLVPASTSHRCQEGHMLLYHTLCEWIDSKVD